MRVALSHDWLNGMRGGEKCLEVLCEMFPTSPILTLFYESGKVSGTISAHPIRSSRLQRYPGILKYYRYYLPFFPGAVDALDAGDCDLIVSTSHCVAKGLRKPKGARHLCYCFTPMRYAWGFFDEYFGARGPLARRAIKNIVRRLREWDLRSSERVDRFAAISLHVQQRIRQFYGREAELIYPPVDTDFFTPDTSTPKEDLYLLVSALVPYKRIDLAIEAFKRLKKPLTIIGSGPELKRLRALAGGWANFLGWRSDTELRDHYRRARALIFPGQEDFGIVPVEAQACGTPVIAYRKGGALETVNDGQTGAFFDEATPESLCEAVRTFERSRFDPGLARVNAQRFSKGRFRAELEAFIKESMG